jgi:pimeloyl-ACP methyl ester carboxylesterase
MTTTTSRVPPVVRSWRDEYVVVDGIRTHYLAAGEGTPLVLLHSGEFGATAELSWEYLVGDLAKRHRVIAPDWLGFGETDLIHDFTSKRGRMLAHLTRFLEVVDVQKADFVGNSMGASFLIHDAAVNPGRLPIDKLISISGGGFVPANEDRAALLDYDGSLPWMKRVVRSLVEDPLWYEDDEYVARRHELSIRPGAWESIAVSRFKAPFVPERSDYGQADTTPYENIQSPTLLIVGALDKLREPGYSDPLVERIPNVQRVILEDAGHCPNIEAADDVLAAITGFIDA